MADGTSSYHNGGVEGESFNEWYESNLDGAFSESSASSGDTVLDLSDAGAVKIINETTNPDGTLNGTVEFQSENGDPVAWGHFEGVDAIIPPDDPASRFYSEDDFTVIGQNGDGLPLKVSLDEFLSTPNDEVSDPEGTGSGGTKGSGSGGSGSGGTKGSGSGGTNGSGSGGSGSGGTKGSDSDGSGSGGTKGSGSGGTNGSGTGGSGSGGTKGSDSDGSGSGGTKGSGSGGTKGSGTGGSGSGGTKGSGSGGSGTGGSGSGGTKGSGSGGTGSGGTKGSGSGGTLGSNASTAAAANLPVFAYAAEDQAISEADVMALMTQDVDEDARQNEDWEDQDDTMDEALW